MPPKNKLNISPLPEQTSDYSHYEENVVRWDRIISVIALAILALGLVVYWAFSEKAEPISSQSADQDQTIHILPKNTPKPAGNEQKALLTHRELANAELEKAEHSQTKALANNPPPTKTVSQVPQKSPSAHQAIDKIAADTQNDQNLAITPKPTAIKATPSTQKPATPASNQAESNPQINPASVLIVNSAISRATLSLTIKDNEPGIPLNNSVIMPNEGIIKVILFTQMNGLKGNTLYHEWYRNGEQQARVKIPVNVNTQRSFSSKYINKQMLGQWQVKVLDEQREPYVLADFEVIER